MTIGTFDGVHLGHQQILKQLIATSKKAGLKSVLLTFFPHPRMVLQPDISMHLIQTIEEREQVLGKTGLDYLVIHPFTSDFSRLSAEDYVKTILVDRLNTKKLWLVMTIVLGETASQVSKKCIITALSMTSRLSK